MTMDSEMTRAKSLFEVNFTFPDPAIPITYGLDVNTTFYWIFGRDSAEAVVADLLSPVHKRMFRGLDGVWDIMKIVFLVQIDQAVLHPVFQALKRVELRITYVGPHPRDALGGLP